MNTAVSRILNLVPRGQHAADALTDPPQRPVTRQAVAANLTARRELTAQADMPTVVIPALNVDVSWPSRVPIAEDYRALPVFRSTARDACAVGLRGIGTRGASLVAPLPDWGLDGAADSTEDAGDDLGPEWDQVAEHYEAGFYNARRVFHSADTADFPAVAS